MSQTASAPVKVCVLCNQDVSKKPRVKDPQGRYLCEPCFAKSQAKPQAAAQPAARPAAQPAPTPKPAPKPAAPADDNPLLDALDTGEGEGGDVLLPEGYDPSLAAAAATAKPEAPVRAHLPKPTDPGAKKGKKSSAPPEFSCRHCGYNMAGTMSLRCPECGKMNMAPKNDALVQTEREVRRATYLRPLILMGVGWGISLLALVIGGASLEAYARVAISWVIAVPLGVLTFWVCSLIFLEYDAPYHITALRLGGIYACVGIADAIAHVVGINAFGYAALGLLILLYMTELEMERWEAIAMAVVGFVVNFAALLAVIFGLGLVFGVATAMSGPGAAPTPTPAFVSPSDPTGTIYYDANSDGVDDDTGNAIPKDAVPYDDAESTDGPQPGEETTDGGE